MKKLFKTIATIVIIGAGIYYFREPLGDVLQRAETRFLPCWQPIYYKIGSFDKRFGISQENFLAAVARAEAIWEKPISKNLFEHATDGSLKINLIYDNRQAATQRLKTIGTVVGSDRLAYDSLKAQYETLRVKFEQDSAEYDNKVRSVNARGGANRDEYSQLKAAQEGINAQVDALNGMAIELNDLGAKLNLNVEKYNAVGRSNGEEFNEGLYVSEPAGVRIDIYQYDNQAKLVRVLAHELGHALGLDHVDDKKAIMYRLNQATNEKLSAVDLASLKVRCGIK